MATIDEIVQQVISALQEQSRNTEALPQEGNAGSVGSFVALKKADNSMVQVPISVIETMINEKFNTLLNGTDPDKIDSITDLVNWVSEHGADAAEMASAIQANTTAIANEVTRAKDAEKALSDRIDNIPTGGGGAGDIADGAVTENKLSIDVAGKLNTAYDKANLADTLFLNDGILFKKGVLIEEGVRENVTGYAYSNKILGNGETITVDDGYTIINYKLYEGEEEQWFDNNYNKTTIPLDKGYVYQFSVMRDGGSAITNYNDIVKSFIRNPYAWDNNSNLNNFICAGRYTISGSREANAQDNMPIYNDGKVEAKLQVLEADNCIMQILTLLNVGGGDGNVYTRVRQNGTWEQWGKLQSNIEVGRVEGNNPFDNYTDNGMYSGVYAYGSTAETFVLVVINAYLYGGGVAQLKYSTLLDGTTEVKLRTRVNGVWGGWKGLGGGGSYTLPVATADVLGGVKATVKDSNITASATGDVYFDVVVDKRGKAFAALQKADQNNYGIVQVDSSVNPGSNNPVSGKGVADAIAEAITNTINTPV